MWLATQIGFYSVVQKAPGVYHVRARERGDLENLLELAEHEAEIHEWAGADYPCRVIIDLETLLEIMVRLAGTLDYENFKERIHAREDQRHKLDAYHSLHSLLRRSTKPWPS